MSEIYKPILDEIDRLGGEANELDSLYIMLHSLAMAKGRKIYDSPSKVGKVHGIPQRKIDRLAKEALNQYLKSGLLILPTQFKAPEHVVSVRGENIQTTAARMSQGEAGKSFPSEGDSAGNMYKPIIDEVNSLGGRATGGETLYVLLHRLAKVKGKDMNGSAAMVGRAAGIPRSKINNLAKDALRLYLNSGHLVIPSCFNFRESGQYMHDGDAEADRNLWRKNRKIYTAIPEGDPLPEYTFNTAKK